MANVNDIDEEEPTLPSAHPGAAAKETATPQDAATVRRRELLRNVMIGGVGLTVTKWSTPVVQSVILPAHAQATGGLGGSTNVQNNIFPPSG